MIEGLFDTISSSIDSVGGLLGWLFIGAVIVFALRGNNGSNRNNSSKSSG